MAHKYPEKKREYNRAWKQANKEKVRATNKAYRESHQDEIKAYRESHKEETKVSGKAWREANKDYWKDKDPYEEAEKKGITDRACPSCSHMSGREKLPLRAFFTHSSNVNGLASQCKDCRAYSSSKRRSKGKHTLTREYFIEVRQKPCVYCGREAILIDSNSVDRIESSKFYTKNNVQPSCDVCNKSKLDHSHEDFIEHSISVVKYQGYTVVKEEDSVKYMIRTLENLGYIIGRKRQQTFFGD
jgi:hypothetical protein